MCEKIRCFGSAIILAGGKSTRMGFDKQLISINEKRLMDSIASRLARVFDDIVVVSNTPEMYIGSGYKVVTDVLRGKGPLGGLHAGLCACSSQYSYLIACDMPNINFEYIEYMKSKIRDHIEKGGQFEACVTRQGEWMEPFNAFYSKNLVKDIENHLNGERRSVSSFLENQKVIYIEEETARKFSPLWSMFFNMNTRKDIDAYIDSLGRV